MTITPKELISRISDVNSLLAAPSLNVSQAKLYSHYTKLRTGSAGLTGWRPEEFSIRLDEAMQLLELAISLKYLNSSDWKVGLKRAAELFEWLSHPLLNVDNKPLKIFAASCYQLAGYPARASGLIAELTPDLYSEILILLLKADFNNLYNKIQSYWASQSSTSIFLGDPSLINSDDDLMKFSINEVIRIYGIICAEFRWGEESRLANALEKLDHLSKFFLINGDSQSWILCKLSLLVIEEYIQKSLRIHTAGLSQNLNSTGVSAFEKYCRYNHLNGRGLLWESQLKGVDRLKTDGSFVLCTPTGTGKTTVAELAILQALFSPSNLPTNDAPLVIYITPTRALAAEVEARLNKVFNSLGANIITTGLYGGADWGATDAWLTSDEKTVLICTFEKADALMRFLGPIIIKRVKTVIIDEAHNVQFNSPREDLVQSNSRAMKLESIGSRLLYYFSSSTTKIIALSAVATGIESALASWVSGSPSVPVKTDYRSTRQLIGRLEHSPQGAYTIFYDLLDKADLRFNNADYEAPFVPRPFADCPLVNGFNGPEKKLRPPTLWAAMHLAAKGADNMRRSVLISITQKPEDYAKDFLDLLNNHWSTRELPDFFETPTDPSKLVLWNKCTSVCKDYFGQESREYKLLLKGIVLHHGKMPGLMARLLVQVVEARIINIILATSTLSEGVNLPFETILIPTLQRMGATITLPEFNNLAGRAGRPGYGLEGRVLVLTSAGERPWRYNSIISEILNVNPSLNSIVPKSALAETIKMLESEWQNIPRAATYTFNQWLEEAIPANDDTDGKEILLLDALDAFITSSIVELEKINNVNLTDVELEGKLKALWSHTYAKYSDQREAELENIFIRRGKAVNSRIYSHEDRKMFYKTGLPPKSAKKLLEIKDLIVSHIRSGKDYYFWNNEQQFLFCVGFIELLSTHHKFSVHVDGTDWKVILRWWLDFEERTINPSESKISKWYDHISKKFIYKINWGIGSILGLEFESLGESFQSLSFDTWPQLNLPWIAFWLKELITWGTLDPVVAFLLSKGACSTRAEAKIFSDQYRSYAQQQNIAPSDFLNPRNIRAWVEHQGLIANQGLSFEIEMPIVVRLENRFQNKNLKLRVVPITYPDHIIWSDLAGYVIAKSDIPSDWSQVLINTKDFSIDTQTSILNVSSYF